MLRHGTRRARIDDGVATMLAASGAIALALDAAFENGKDCIQVLGGIGFTWEHEAHMYLKRAMSLGSILGPSSRWRTTACSLALDGVRRGQSVDLGPEADALRTELRAFLAEVAELAADEQRRRVADAGYLMPTWPPPWGRGAKAVEQVVIDEEFRAAKVARPGIMIGSWALPPVIMYGTQEQQERWIPPTLRGEITWCQLFSEPGAGSDLASLSTRARARRGWVGRQRPEGVDVDGAAPPTGASCWRAPTPRSRSTTASRASWSTCSTPTASTSGRCASSPATRCSTRCSSTTSSCPTTASSGQANDGWRSARTTLANERVFMGGGMSLGHGLENVLKMVAERDLADDPFTADEVGGLVVTAHALGCLGFRLTLAALAGADPSGSEASVRKLLGVVHDQHVQEVGLALCGVDGAIAEGDGKAWSRGFLFNRNLTIAGGTSEIQRNIIGERVLGLPRDP